VVVLRLAINLYMLHLVISMFYLPLLPFGQTEVLYCLRATYLAFKFTIYYFKIWVLNNGKSVSFGIGGR
jgi:hypothetical protein